ncbi:MAG: glycosyltransferase [Nostochopsis sp.]
MNNFEHFILTRFNVKTVFGKSNIGLNFDWLNHRFQLFDDFCYPSVRAQSNQNFKWIVYFDSNTPDCFKSKIKEYAEWQNFIPIYLDTEFTDDVNRKNVLKLLNKNTNYLITTRLDNDDAVSNNFVQMIQENFIQQKFEFLNFTNGYVLNNGKIYYFKYLKNPFMTLIEQIDHFSVEGFKTILCGQHTELSKMGIIKQVKCSPTWLQVIHTRNVSNRVRGIRHPIKNLAQSFLINPKYLNNHEEFIPYLIDKTWTIVKYPLESFAIALPKEIRVPLRNIIETFKNN